MNAQISMLVVCVEKIIYLLLYNLHDCTFKISALKKKRNTLFKAVESQFK